MRGPLDPLAALPAPPDDGRGLTTAEASQRLARDGPNALPRPRGPHPLRQFLAQLTHRFALLLWAAAGLALLAGMPSLGLAIAVVVLLNAGFAFAQEFRADRSVDRLRDLLPTGVRVVRSETPLVVPAETLVTGDLVLLAAGDRVAADMRLLNGSGLHLDESMVTGESAPVPREPGDPVLAGSFVARGEARAVVTATGSGTSLAGISALSETAARPRSPLTLQLDRVVRVVTVVAVLTGVTLGIAGRLLGLDATSSFLFGVGVTVALVPEGLLPTVTLSLARGAQVMAEQHALVRRLDAVETLGATTFICTDKTGTLTQNRMSVVDVVTAAGRVSVRGRGYEPTAELDGPEAALGMLPRIARAAVGCVTGRVAPGTWTAIGDPMDAAIACLAQRCDVPVDDPDRRHPYTPERMLSSALTGRELVVLGAPERVLRLCRELPDVEAPLAELTGSGRRVLAVATRTLRPGRPHGDAESDEQDLTFLALLGLEDPPREGVNEALVRCRHADIRVAMLTGDHPRTAEAIANEVGLLRPGGVVTEGAALPADDATLAALLDSPDGVVVARVTPADKFRIARVLRERGHVVAMTGDGVNDAPALREADVGVAMGASGSDVAREAADLVLLDDHFATIVTAVALGRSTFHNIRRFLTYHLTDNVAELAPFAAWALSGGQFPLAIGVLQVLALDIGTDLLPALALGAEPPSRHVLDGRGSRDVIDRGVLVRAFGVLGPTEAVLSLAAFAVVLLQGGWRWGATPSASLLATASGTAFAAIALAQMGNALACRSTTTPVWRLNPAGNRLVLYAVATELVLLVTFLGVPPIAGLLGSDWPTPGGWLMGLASVGLLVVVDGAVKRRARRSP